MLIAYIFKYKVLTQFVFYLYFANFPSYNKNTSLNFLEFGIGKLGALKNYF